MATTIATAAAEVIERLVIADGAGAHPTTAMIEGFVRAGFKRMWAVATPIFRDAFTVNATNGITTIDANLTKVWYVSGPRDFLVPSSEYVETDTGVNFRRANEISPVANDEVVVWFSTAPTDFGAAASIESSCVFGPDWLEEAALMYAEIQALQRLARVHDSGVEHDASAGQAVLLRDLNRHVEELISMRREWKKEMDQHISLRLQARGITREAEMSNWNNESRLENTTVDAYHAVQTRRDRSRWR